jgi:hypothetical protein
MRERGGPKGAWPRDRGDWGLGHLCGPAGPHARLAYRRTAIPSYAPHFVALKCNNLPAAGVGRETQDPESAYSSRKSP